MCWGSALYSFIRLVDASVVCPQIALLKCFAEDVYRTSDVLVLVFGAIN